MKTIKKYFKVLALIKIIDSYKTQTTKGPKYKYAEIGKSLVQILDKEQYDDKAEASLQYMFYFLFSQ